METSSMVKKEIIDPNPWLGVKSNYQILTLHLRGVHLKALKTIKLNHTLAKMLIFLKKLSRKLIKCEGLTEPNYTVELCTGLN